MIVKAYTNKNVIDVSSNDTRYLCRKFRGYKIDKFSLDYIKIYNRKDIEDLIEILNSFKGNLKGTPSGFEKNTW